MNVKLKTVSYFILVGLSLWFGWRFYQDYSLVLQSGRNAGSTNAAVLKPAGSNQTALAAVQTNMAEPATNTLAATNDAAVSNNVRPALTPEPAPTNASPADNSAATTPPSPGARGPRPEIKGGNLVVDLAAFVLSVVGLGLLIAYDTTQIIASRAADLLFNDKGELMRDPEYERAEAAWADGRHLEAVEMMREYLKKHPREQFVALRIAEIYEKDLHNYVAASLEYEEILKKRLPDERWGWAAIHLCNIYSKLGQQEKVGALLQKIARNYPRTGAAKKARRNLGLPEPEEAAAPAQDEAQTAGEQTDEQGPVFDLDEAIASTEQAAPLPPPETAPETPPEGPPKPGLPPGFRPKK
jgi:TolA-binding protein